MEVVLVCVTGGVDVTCWPTYRSLLIYTGHWSPLIHCSGPAPLPPGQPSPHSPPSRN